MAEHIKIVLYCLAYTGNTNFAASHNLHHNLEGVTGGTKLILCQLMSKQGRINKKYR